MKRNGLFTIYLLILVALVVGGFLLDPTLGAWRQGCVGVLLLAIGVLFRAQVSFPKANMGNDTRFSVAASLLLAGAVLMAFSVRLLSAEILQKLRYNAPLVYPGLGIGSRILATVLLPTLCAPILGLHVLPTLCPKKSKFATIGCCMIAYCAFCTSPVHLPSALVLGGAMGVLALFWTGNAMVYTFVSYFMLMFYDTFAISLGTMDYNLSFQRVVSFFLFALAIAVIIGYAALILARKRKLHMGELLTVLLVAVVIILIAVAI